MTTVLNRNFKVKGNLIAIYKPGLVERLKFISDIEVYLWCKAPMEKIFLGKALTDKDGDFVVEFELNSPSINIVDGQIRNAFIEAYYNGVKLNLDEGNSLLEGLVAYWKLDETSGLTAADATDNGHEGTLSGSTLPSWEPGKINYGLMIHGAVTGLQESFLSVPDSDDFDFGTGDFAFSFWMQPNNNTLYYCLIDTGYDDAGSFSLIYALSEAEFRIYSSGSDVYTKSYTIVAAEWYHLVARRVNGVFDICINGVSLGGESFTGVVSVTRILAFGSWRASGQTIDGVMDEIGVWKGRSLSDAEVLQLYNDGAGLQYPFN